MRKLHGKPVLALAVLAVISFSQIAASGTFSKIGPHFQDTTLILPDGKQIDTEIINGPSKPPPGFDRESVALPAPDKEAGVATLAVPAFTWFLGCSATSGAMIAAYFDRNGYPNMYNGITNDGLIPMDNSAWPTWADGVGDSYGQCPLTASRNGLDGRTTRGSIDDYWVSYDSAVRDPFMANGWGEHTYGDAIGDYMKTSQSEKGNADGSTTFFTWTSSASPLTCTDMEGYGIHYYDGTYGRKLFYQARGYTITDCYTQRTDNSIAGGFSFSQFQAEIDAGRPVLINLLGHTIVGLGYDTATNTVYLHDTWDLLSHSMTWGGSYFGMSMESVSIVNFTSPTLLPTTFNKSYPANGYTTSYHTASLIWNSSTNSDSYEYCVDTVNNNTCDTYWYPQGKNTVVDISGLIYNTTYYWQIRAVNGAGNTFANGGTWWSLNCLPPLPGDFGKLAPMDLSVQSTSPTLSWSTSTGANSYDYCIDTTDNDSCDGSWISTGTSTSAGLSGLAYGTHYYWQVRANNVGGSTYAEMGPAGWWGFTTIPAPPGAFGKSAPASGSFVATNPTLSWGASSGATRYEYCSDTSNDLTCDSSWISTGTSTSIPLSGLTNNRAIYWQVRAVNSTGTTYADGGTWWSFTARNQTFADVPIDHPFWTYIEAMYNSGVTTGCGVSPLIYCPDSAVTRAAMAVFLLRAKYGSSYAPPPASHFFADVPFTGKEWMEPWIDQFYLEGITTGCGADPLIYCPENTTTRAAMAVFILRAKFGSSYTPPAASHFFSDLPVAGKEWMEPWVDELYREGITTGCGTGPLIYCPETAVKRQAMAAFIVRAFNLPLP